MNSPTPAEIPEHGHAVREITLCRERADWSSISNLSSNLMFYLVSGNDAYMVQNDSNVEFNGTISKQQ